MKQNTWINWNVGTQYFSKPKVCVLQVLRGSVDEPDINNGLSEATSGVCFSTSWDYVCRELI